MTIIEAELVEQPDELDAGMPIDVVVSHPSRGVMRFELVDTWGGRLVFEADYDDLGYAIMAPAAEIIDEIANRDPNTDLGGKCYYCGVWRPVQGPTHPSEHKASCLWRRARSL